MDYTYICFSLQRVIYRIIVARRETDSFITRRARGCTAYNTRRHSSDTYTYIYVASISLSLSLSRSPITASSFDTRALAKTLHERGSQKTKNKSWVASRWESKICNKPVFALARSACILKYENKKKEKEKKRHRRGRRRGAALLYLPPSAGLAAQRAWCAVLSVHRVRAAAVCSSVVSVFSVACIGT